MKNLDILAKSWSVAAVGYNEIFVPKFAPWTLDVLEALKELPLPSSSSSSSDGKQQNTGSSSNSHVAISSSFATKIQRTKQCYHCCVPCCGPGQELIPISNILGNSWSITGVDIAPGMIQVAKERILLRQQQQRRRRENCITIDKQQQRIQAVIGDCSSTLPLPISPTPQNQDHCTSSSSSKESLCYDLIVSIFGFQQMDDPETVLENWLNCLNDDAFLLICFWPSSIESFDENDDAQKTCSNYIDDIDPTATTKMNRPFSLFSQVMKNHLDSSSSPQTNNSSKVGEGNDTKEVSLPSSSKRHDGSNGGGSSNKNDMEDKNPGKTATSDELSWDDALVAKIQSFDSSCKIIKDEYLTHSLQWDDFDQFWDSMTNSGPWHSMRLKRGDTFVDGILKADYQRHFPNQSSFVHQARARLLILQQIKRKDR